MQSIYKARDLVHLYDEPRSLRDTCIVCLCPQSFVSFVVTKSRKIEDVRRCYISDRRIWLRVRDPNSSRRRLSPASQRSLDLYAQRLSRIPPIVSLWPQQIWKGLCVADAYAAGSVAGIGGVVNFPCGHNSWFSLPLKLADFERLQIPVHTDLQKDISTLETLAQIGLLYVVALKQLGF